MYPISFTSVCNKEGIEDDRWVKVTVSVSWLVLSINETSKVFYLTFPRQLSSNEALREVLEREDWHDKQIAYLV